jgi:hypothetical protein
MWDAKATLALFAASVPAKNGAFFSQNFKL